MPVPPVILSIAGYDPSSGAGITADIKTAAAIGCYAVTCITALTVQSTQGVFAVEPVRPEIVRETLSRLRQDFEIAAVRIGMLGSSEVADEVASFLECERLPNVVLDPIVRSSSGMALIDPFGLETLRSRLLPLSALITPNVEEAAVLAGAPPLPPGTTWESVAPRIRQFAGRLHAMGARAVLITGGHLAEPVDYLSLLPAGDTPARKQLDANQGREPSAAKRTQRVFRGQHIESRATHGTGCALATAVACLLGHGADLVKAVAEAKDLVRQAIREAYPLGKGVGPVNPLFRLGSREDNEN